MTKKSIIITRPLEDSNNTAKMLAENNIDYFIEPALGTKLTTTSINLLTYDGVIVTSKNAIRAIKNINHNTKIISLGKSTTSLAKENNFTNVEYAGQNVNELCDYLKLNYSNKSFIYASGKTITKEINKKNSGNNISRIIVYETSPINHLSESFQEKLKLNCFAGVMFFSKKTAEIFFSNLKKQGLEKYCGNLYAFCLSKNIAEFIKNYGFKATMYPKNPNIAEIIKLIVKFRF